MQIKLPDDFLAYAPIYAFSNSRKDLDGIPSPSGADTEGMKAAQSLLSLYKDVSALLKAYGSLVEYDGERMKKIVESFKRFDQSH